MHIYRTHDCARLRAADAGATARLSGWVHRKRDHGGVLFVDLRDHYGITQIVANTGSAAFAVLADHHAALTRYWTPDAESYTGLGGRYVEDPDFRARYDAVDPRLAGFYRDAMAAYATARLS